MNISKLVNLPRLFADLRCVGTPYSVTRLASSNATSAARKSEPAEEDDSLYQKEYSNKVKFLERFGMVKPHISWPQYNRIIYPPNETGEPVKRPVRKTFKLTNIKN
jgi:hypothetical protein